MKKTFITILLFNIFLSLNLFAAKNLYLSYKKIPTNVYKNQKFEVTVKALITTTNFDNLTTSFFNHSNIAILNPNSQWKKISYDVYENTFYFKVKNSNFRLPDIEVKLLNGNSIIDTSQLSTTPIRYSDIGKGDERYSNVIADKILLKAYKTKQYNNNEALTIIDIDGINSNLEDFKLKNIAEQGVSAIKELDATQNLVYYFVTPIYQKNLIFTYYNSATKSFKDIKVPLILQNELVSTQTDLNPNDSTFEKYKKIAALVLFGILFLLTLWKRKKILIFFTIISFMIALFYNLPNAKGVVKKDSFVYILPTKNSTIFFKIENDQKVEILEKKNGFIKILGLENGFIGWIKEESFGTN
ncbi:MAG: SH3 domain-containing protein [Erysipelotrichia bacterium]|nr:SH3 domain-containing protein [Erysipelotrichia bacterium]